MSEVDARAILEKYAAVLNAPSMSVIRDAKDLPYSKDAIKTVLKHFLSKTVDPQGREVLKKAYMDLANFQPLTEDERKSVVAMSEVSDARSTDKDLLKQAQIVVSHGELHQAVVNRSNAEHEALFLEIRAL